MLYRMLLIFHLLEIIYYVVLQLSESVLVKGSTLLTILLHLK